MASLSQLPSELKWQLYCELDAPDAGALCSVSSEFSAFCQQRLIRIATLVNYYKHASKPEKAYIKLLQYGKDARDVERLEALITLHPGYLEMVSDQYTITLANPLMATALFQLGFNPMLPVPPSSDPWNISLLLAAKGKVPVLTRLGESTLRLAIRIPKSRVVITERVWELLPLDALKGMLYLPFTLPEQVLVNMLVVATRKKDYDSARELLERGVNPLQLGRLGNETIPLHEAVSSNNSEVLWLMLHYISPDPTTLLSLLPKGATISEDGAISRYIEGVRLANIDFTSALKLGYPILLYLNSLNPLSFWNDLSFWRLKWVEDIGTEPPLFQEVAAFRMSYRQVLTTPLLIYTVGQQEIQLRADREYERGLLTIFHTTLSKISIKTKFVVGYSINIDQPNLNDSVVEMPVCNYIINVRETKVEFDSLTFLAGMIKACRLIELDPFQTLSEFKRVIFD